MKIRLGFVSNSSSCSFSIISKAIDVKQFDHLRNHIAFAKSKKWDNDGWSSYDVGESWDVYYEDGFVKCSTLMDNFDLHKFVIEVLNVPEDAIIDYFHT